MSDRQEMANMVVQDRNIEKEKSVENQLFFFSQQKGKERNKMSIAPVQLKDKNTGINTLNFSHLG